MRSPTAEFMAIIDQMSSAMELPPNLPLRVGDVWQLQSKADPSEAETEPEMYYSKVVSTFEEDAFDHLGIAGVFEWLDDEDAKGIFIWLTDRDRLCQKMPADFAPLGEEEAPAGEAPEEEAPEEEAPE